MSSSIKTLDGEPQVNILMVDDSPDKLLAMESVLSSLGQNLVKARSGEEALRLLLKNDYALILLDVNMPGMDGFETAQMIRNRKATAHTPIIFVTALSTTDADVFKGYAFGAVDYLLTPIVPEILKTKVGVFVDLWKQRRELEARAEALKSLNLDLERRAQQLSAVNRELESFCYTIAHDLRAPLRAMEGLTSLLIEEHLDKMDGSAHQYAEGVRGAAARMDQMIQELLVYSRLTLIDFKLRPTRILRVIDEALAQVTWDLEHKGAEINIDRSDVQVLAQHSILVQVIVNLISNAVKFVAPDTRPIVNIWTAQEGSFLRLWIEDNGIGIAPEHRDRIFRVFERLHGRDHYTGTGIGLAIVEKAVSRMGGRVGLESELGKGSRFWIELPSCGDGADYEDTEASAAIPAGE